jgi:hypothetical protein
MHNIKGKDMHNMTRATRNQDERKGHAQHDPGHSERRVRSDRSARRRDSTLCVGLAMEPQRRASRRVVGSARDRRLGPGFNAAGRLEWNGPDRVGLNR